MGLNLIYFTYFNFYQAMLFAVSIGFILLNLPFAVTTIYRSRLGDLSNFDGHTTKQYLLENFTLDFLTDIGHVLLDLNFISNFFFFYLSGSRFRKKLYLLCCKRCKTKQQSRIIG